MTVTIKKTHEVTTVVAIPDYFTTLQGWYYKALPNDKVLHVTESAISVSNVDACLKHVVEYIQPCTEDQFLRAYCEAMNAITAASGIEYLEFEGGAYAD